MSFLNEWKNIVKGHIIFVLLLIFFGAAALGWIWAVLIGLFSKVSGGSSASAAASAAGATS